MPLFSGLFNHPSSRAYTHRFYSMAVIQNSDFDDHLPRTGTIWSCVAHILTAVIGSGVLSLAWSVAQLGWIGGPASVLCFALITFTSTSLLSDCYRSPHPITGSRNPTYGDAVRVNLGTNSARLCVILQYALMYGVGIAYVIATSTSMRAIWRSNCYHKEGHGAECTSGSKNKYMVMFGVIQLFLCMIPDFNNIKWLSFVAAIMSFSYSFIGMALGLAAVIENGRVKGSLVGVKAETSAKKIWVVFQAFGDIAFAYPYTVILLEIQDTVRSPPPENVTMKKASATAILITTIFYLCCGCFGYAAFGDLTPGNLLTGFGFYEPFWLMDFANACIILHLLGSFQVFSQAVFGAAEGWFHTMFPDSWFVRKFYTLKPPLLPSFRVYPFRQCFRTMYVTSTILIAMMLPYFNLILGLLGALNFWPLTVYFPVKVYIVQNKTRRWSSKWAALQAFSLCCLLLSLVVLVGSIQGLLLSAKLI